MQHRGKRALAALAALPVVVAASGGELLAQEPAEPASDFDIDRAYLADETIFVPFRVEATQPLGQALEEGRIEPQTSVMLMEHPAGRLALVADQLAYHHVAQGEIAGEPWMVSF